MKKIRISKIFITLLVILLCILIVGCKKDNTSGNGGSDTPKREYHDNVLLYFHYKRNRSDYDKWQLWLWTPDQEGTAISPKGEDDFGIYFEIDLSDPSSPYYEADKLGYIYRKGNWELKDADHDRFVSLNDEMIDEYNEIHLYSFQEVDSIYLDDEKKNPVCEIQSFALEASCDKVKFSTNVIGKTYTIFKNNEVYLTGNISRKTTTITLPEPFDISKNDSYELEVVFNETYTLRKSLNISKYYTSTEFTANYTYDGDDLGAIVENDKTTFKLWAPISNAVKVELYRYGHPTSLGNDQYPGDDTPVKSFDLTLGEKGVWSVTVDENLTGYYYTYTVTNGDKTTKDIVDPYAFAGGLNGLRGYIVDFNTTNPVGWSYDRKRLYKPNELVVYELHVRDLTMDDSWTGTEKNRGTYLGMCESGTTYKEGNLTVTTGFDHIKELGVNAVQILPFYDQANDERKQEFNWGYNPQNYNILEGLYSTNPYNAEVRIKEFKEMVMAYNNADIEIIMDVVYNHMYGVSGSSFDKILPGYYFRYKNDGSLWNGSGCGNEVASDHSMVRKYILDSVKFWATEYNLSGFRFDLMGLIDVNTMNQLATELHEIDPNIVIYGEPWTGGSTGLDSSLKADKSNVGKLNGVGMFNDDLRNGIKGDTNGTGNGWVQGGGILSNVTAGLKGLGLGANPQKQLTYITCHDNLALADKLRKTNVSEEQLGNASVLANGMVLTAEGITFLHAGEEILRSKAVYDEDGEFVEYSHNSYNLPDEVNSFKWENKIKYIDAFNAYKTLVNISKEQSAFHFSDSDTCRANYIVKQSSMENIVVEITTPQELRDSNDWSKITVIYSNVNGTNTSYNLEGSWNVALVSGTSNASGKDTVTGTVTAGVFSIVVLYQE